MNTPQVQEEQAAERLDKNAVVTGKGYSKQ